MTTHLAGLGNIPTINVTGSCLPEAWEKAVLAVWQDGVDVKTEYDRPDDPPSKDATVMITVADPFAEPRIHKNFPGGPEELEAYRQEVCEGIHDHWIDPAKGVLGHVWRRRHGVHRARILGTLCYASRFARVLLYLVLAPVLVTVLAGYERGLLRALTRSLEYV